MKELILPAGLIAVIGCMLLPLHPFLVDCLLVMNLVFAILLVASALYLPNPIRLSSLPTIILLATLYRLALNISTTRRILGSGDAGDMIEMFGHLLMQGEIFVGLVVFLVISLVQFIVIAKGSERVAEVSARFTLDALPGKQMSIDADVRSGMIDLETARIKREELQVESRFYGALDGAMKFIKGDAIAGLVITGVNIVGGFLVGMLVRGMDVSVAFQKYTLLTLGDGLLSQVPALLNSLAAGLIVTRVAKDNATPLASEVLEQLGTMKPALILAGVMSGMLAFIGVAILPFIVMCVLFISIGLIASPASSEDGDDPTQGFEPELPALFSIAIKEDSPIRSVDPTLFRVEIHKLLQKLYEEYGLLVPPPDMKIVNDLDDDWQISFRGIPVGAPSSWSEEASQSDEKALKELIQNVYRCIEERKVECIDDLLSRRALDFLEQRAPELVASTVPGIISLTQLTVLLKTLLSEEISIRHLDLILQAISEQGEKAEDARLLVEEVRIALKRVISSRYHSDGIVECIKLDPVIDMWITRSEREGAPLNPEILYRVERAVIEKQEENESSDKPITLVASRGARRLLKDCLTLRGIEDLYVLAEEEIDHQSLTVVDLGEIKLSVDDSEEIFGELAA